MRVDFGKVMERMRELRAKMSVNDSAKRFATMGVDVYQVMLTLDTRCIYISLFTCMESRTLCCSHPCRVLLMLCSAILAHTHVSYHLSDINSNVAIL